MLVVRAPSVLFAFVNAMLTDIENRTRAEAREMSHPVKSFPIHNGRKNDQKYVTKEEHRIPIYRNALSIKTKAIYCLYDAWNDMFYCNAYHICFRDVLRNLNLLC